MGIFGKVLIAISAYTVGSIVASGLDPKKKKEIKKIKKEGGDVVKFLIDDFVITHKKLFASAKDEILNEENKKNFEKKKKQLISLANKYKKQAENILSDLKEKGSKKAEKGLEKLDEIYNEQKNIIDELKEIAPKKANEFKKQLLASAKEIQNELKNKIKK